MARNKVLVGVRAVALIEVGKALIVLLACFGLLALIHRDVEALAEHLVELLHLDPDKRFPHIFIDAAARVTDARLWLLASLAMTYAIARAIEAYGLWHARRWAEWVALLSAAAYVPFEVYELCRGITRLKSGALVINIVIVAYMICALRVSRKNDSAEADQGNSLTETLRR